MKRSYRRLTWWQPAATTALLAGLLLTSLATARRVEAADHRDGPLISNTALTTGNLDLNDLFLFVSPNNRDNTVMVLTTGGNGVGFITPPFFAPGSLYEFRVDNNGDVADDFFFTFIFSDPDRFLRQTFRMFRTEVTTGRFQQIAQGVTGARPASIRGGGQVTAGIFDDPFFFDSLAFPIFLQVVDRGASAGMPNPGPLAERASPLPGPPSRPAPSRRSGRRGFRSTVSGTPTRWRS